MFVSKIKAMRIKRGKSQLQLANAIGVSQSEVSLLELKKRNISVSTIASISVFLDCCPYDLFYFKCKKYDGCDIPYKDDLNCVNTQKFSKYKNLIYPAFFLINKIPFIISQISSEL